MKPMANSRRGQIGHVPTPDLAGRWGDVGGGQAFGSGGLAPPRRAVWPSPGFDRWFGPGAEFDRCLQYSVSAISRSRLKRAAIFPLTQRDQHEIAQALFLGHLGLCKDAS